MHFDMADPTFWVMISFFAFIALLLYYKVPRTVGKALELACGRDPPRARRGAPPA